MNKTVPTNMYTFLIGGEKRGPWRSNPENSLSSDFATSADIHLYNRTDIRGGVYSLKTGSGFLWSSSTTEQPRTGIEPPPRRSIVSSTPALLKATPSIDAESFTTTRTPADYTSSTPLTLWKPLNIQPFEASDPSTQAPKAIRNYGVASSRFRSVNRANTWPLSHDRRSNRTVLLTSLKPNRSTSRPSTLERLTKTFSSTAHSHDTTGSRVSSSPLGTPPFRTTPLTPTLDQDEYYSAYPDYSETLPSQNNSTGN